jgi:hypothetical protein
LDVLPIVAHIRAVAQPRLAGGVAISVEIA